MTTEPAFREKRRLISLGVAREKREVRDALVLARLETQGFLCPICSMVLTVRTAVLDHDHRTEELRDALCPQCNAGLGMFHEDVAALESAINYLHRHKVAA